MILKSNYEKNLHIKENEIANNYENKLLEIQNNYDQLIIKKDDEINNLIQVINNYKKKEIEFEEYDKYLKKEINSKQNVEEKLNNIINEFLLLKNSYAILQNKNDTIDNDLKNTSIKLELI